MNGNWAYTIEKWLARIEAEVKSIREGGCKFRDIEAEDHERINELERSMVKRRELWVAVLVIVVATFISPEVNSAIGTIFKVLFR